MAEETKQEAPKTSDSLKTIGKILIGVIVIALGLLLCLRWRADLIGLIKGCIGPSLILVGLVFIAIAKE